MKLFALTSQATRIELPSTTVYILLAMLALVAIFLIVKLVKWISSKRSGDDSPKPNPNDAAIAAAIAASIVASEDRALVAAITAAVQAYLDAENAGKSSLPTGFRVVSFKRRTEGSWNRK